MMGLLTILFVAFMIAAPLGVIWFRSISRTCPDCAERVDKRANVCRYCGHRFAAGVE